MTELDVAGMVSGWNGLAVADREHIIADHPEVVGAADGLAAWARDRANRVLLDRADVELARQEELLRPQAIGGQDGLLTGLGGVLSIGTFGGGTRRTAYEQVVAKIAAVRAVRQVLSQDDGRTRELMALDLSGRSAKVAVSIGDVDHADHVAVLVDGFTTSVQRDLAGADQAAARLDALARRQAMGWGDRGEVAVVTWMAYDAPQTADTLRSPHSVALRASAEAGAAPLASFLAGISRSGGSDRHLTLVGHSYGSTTAGLAVARGGSHIDDLVVMGSPGLGVDSAQRLGMPAARVHVLEADDDPVADLGWFGRDPDQLAGVDVLSTAAAQLPDGSTAARTSGHSSYLTGGTTSQWNVAAVVAGVPALARVRPAGR